MSLRLGALAALTLVVGTLPLVASAATASTNTTTTWGTLEICKSAANGMTGLPFQFSVSGSASTVSVVGGGCSSPLTVPSGKETVTELATGLPAGDSVTSITVSPSGRLVSKTLSAKTVTVKVPANSTVTNETVAHFTNKVQPGQLKICKVSANSNLVGNLFSFTENGGAPFSIAAGTPASPVCSSLKNFAVGTNVSLAELATLNVHVASITASGSGTLSGVSTSAGTATVTIAPGTTVVTYDNEPNPVLQTGDIEICKSGANGMTGSTFQFSVSGSASTVSVVGGQCSSPLTVPSGQKTVTELATGLPKGDSVTSITVSPSGRLVSKTLSAKTVTVKVPANSTVTNETVAHFTNKVQPGQLKICKVSANSNLVGNLFSFTENGGAPFSIAAGTPASPVCSSLKNFAVGTNVSLAELATLNVHVASITASGSGTLSGVSTSAGTATVTIAPGTTVVTYDNEPNAIAQTGYIEICKDASDQFVVGSFTFTLSAPSFTDTVSVPVGECSGPILVPAGNVAVAETERSPYYVSDVLTVPSGALVSQNDTNATAVVSVPVSTSTSDETQVHVVNNTAFAQLKVCKALTANSGALAGQTFTFNVVETFTSTTGGSTAVSVPVTAGSAGSTLCTIVGGTPLPLGTNVTVTEVVPPGSDFTPVSGSPSSLTIGSGINVATVTNEALGTIEVCKNLVAGEAIPSPNVSFPFTISDGGVTINVSVPVNQCSLPETVPAGTATVTEGSVADYHFVSATGNGSTLLSSPTSNPATYSVPAGGVGTETVATFTNAVNAAQFKICKLASNTILDGTSFAFSWSYTVNGTTTTGTASLEPNQCSSLQGPIPVINADGTPVEVYVTEGATPVATVQSIVVSGSGTLAGSDTADGTSTITLGTTDGGITTDTYTNAPVLAGQE